MTQWNIGNYALAYSLTNSMGRILNGRAIGIVTCTSPFAVKFINPGDEQIARKAYGESVNEDGSVRLTRDRFVKVREDGTRVE